MPNRKPNQTMEKPTVKNVQSQVRFLRLALIASVGFPLLFVANAFAQLAAPAAPAAAEATAERVIVTGSNIPTAEETGPNPVDTYRVEDIQKLGVRNSTDLQTIIPQEAGGTINTSIGKVRTADGPVARLRPRPEVECRWRLRAHVRNKTNRIVQAESS